MRRLFTTFLCWIYIIPSGPALVLASLFALAPMAKAQVSNIEIRANYATEQAICYDAPDEDTTPVEVIVATDAGLTEIINDFNPAMFSGSDEDLTRPDTTIEGGAGHVRCIHVGHSDVQYDANDIPQSRATQALTTLYYSIGGETGSYTTSNAPLNSNYSHTHQADPLQPGGTLHPYFSYTDRSQVIIDPQTGYEIRRLELPDDQIRNNATSATSCSGDVDTWYTCKFSLTNWSPNLGENLNVDGLGVVVNGLCSSGCGTTADRELDVQFSYEGQTFSDSVTLTLPTMDSDTTVFANGTSTVTLGQPWAPLRNRPRDYFAWQPERLSNSSNSTTVNFSGTSVCGQLAVGTRIYVTGSSAYTIAGLTCSGSPYTMTLSEAIDLGGNSYSFAAYWGWEHNPQLTVRVRRKNAGASTLQVDSVGMYLWRGDNPGGTSGGFHGQMQIPTYSVANTHLIGLGDRLYSWNSSTQEVVMMGSPYTSCSGGVSPGIPGIGFGKGSRTFDNAVGGRLWGIMQSGGLPVVVKVDYTADPTVPVTWPVDGSIPTIAATCSVITPVAGGNDVYSLIEGWDAAFNSDFQAVYGCSLDNITGAGDLVIVCRRNGVSSQDSAAYVAIFDPGNGSPLGSGGTGQIIAGNFVSLFANDPSINMSQTGATMHTVYNPTDGGTWTAWQTGGRKSEAASPGTQALTTELVDYCADAMQPADPDDCMSWVAGLPIQSANTQTWIHVTSEWDAMWGTQPAGYEEGDPLAACANATCLAIDRWIQGFRVGDYLNKGYVAPEYLEIMDIAPVDGTGRPLKVLRAAFYAQDMDYYGPDAWSAGESMNAQAIGTPFISGVAWDYAASPTGSDTSAIKYTSWPGGGHQGIQNNYGNAGPDHLSYIINGLDTVNQMMASDDAQATTVDRPTEFAGQSTQNPGECTEQHPGQGFKRGSGATSAVSAPDIMPLIGNAGQCFNSPPSNTPATLVSWPIYKYAADDLTIHPKHFDTLLTAGPYLLRNISGPGSELTTSVDDWWKACYALLAGECYAGSDAGDLYMSAPNLLTPYCTGTSASYIDLCVGDLPLGAGSGVEFLTPSEDNYTDPEDAAAVTGIRVAFTAGFVFRAQPNTSNAKALPPNGESWITGTSSAPNIPRLFSIMPRPPARWVSDGVDRTTWVTKTLSISSVPMGTDRVAVKIGYNEDLYPSQNRAETGYVVTATIDEDTPYLWESEWDGEGVSCAVSCDVELPSIWGRVLQMQVVYLDSMGMVLSSGPRLMEAAQSDPPPADPGGAFLRNGVTRGGVNR